MCTDRCSNNYFASQNELHLFDHTTEETLIYETYNPGRPNSHVLSGGCEKCQAPGLSLEQRREAQRIFDDNGFGLGESNSPDWDDEVEDNCITDIVITGMVSAYFCLPFIYPISCFPI